MEDMRDELTNEIGLRANEDAQAMVKEISETLVFKMNEQQS